MDGKIGHDDLSISETGLIHLSQLVGVDDHYIESATWTVDWVRSPGSGWFAASEVVLLRLDPKTEAYLPRILEWMGVDVKLIPGMVAMHKNWIQFSEDERRGLGTASEFRSVDELLGVTEDTGQ